ncbi:MAG: M6 family metalloprotease domain-containing protein [Bacteroidales bacterium]
MQIFAVPAPPYPQTYKQKDGTSLTFILKGDEKFSWAESVDGYALLTNAQGIYEYAVKNKNGDLVPSGVKAWDVDKRKKTERTYLASLPKGLKYSSEQMALIRQVWQIKEQSLQRASVERTEQIGERKIPIILIAYHDVAFRYAKSDFDALLNQPKYTLNQATGSVYDYFMDNSNGALMFTTDVYGPYTLANNRDYYGGNDKNENDKNPQEMVKEALALAATTCDYSKYDLDKNGHLDGLHIVFAGHGEENGGGPDAIWSHAWNIAPPITYNGTSISDYSCSPEMGSGTALTNIGVIVHEMSHVLGLPDLYDTDYERQGEAVDLGSWDVMAGGGWNNDGKTPPLHNVWSRALLGWQKKVVLQDSAVLVVMPANIESKAYNFASKTEKENFWLENRGYGKWDAMVPAKGLLIYHVDENNAQWYSNCINCVPSKRGFYIKEADGGNNSTAAFGTGTPFPGSKQNTSFTDISSPNALSWNKQKTEKPITNIHFVGDAIVFDFNGGAPKNPDTTKVDVEINSIVAPVKNDFFTATEPLTVSIQNKSASTAKMILLMYGIQGEGYPVYTDTLAKLDSGECVVYTCKQHVNLYEPKEYTLTFKALVSRDTNLSNNTAQITLRSLANKLSLSNLISPSGIAPFSAQEKVIYELQNNGDSLIDMAYVQVQVNDKKQYDTLYNLPLGRSIDTLPVTIDMSNKNQEYILKIAVRVVKNIDTSYKVLEKIFPRIVGIEKVDSKVKVEIYPNPAKEYIQIEANSMVDGISLIDMKGVIRSLPVQASKQQKIDIQNYPKGSYILRLHLVSGENVSRSVIFL